MNKVLTNLSTLALCLLSMAACTSENSEELSPDDPTSPVNGDTDRREVLMTIKNTLSLTPSGTKAGGPATKAIALAEENHIGMLDVYVFGSATEDGVYTFQERFAYREDPVTFPIPTGATKLDLTFGGVDNNQLNGTLRIKKGLFVKLYGVANNPALGDPSGLIGKSDPFGNGEMYMNDADYKPLTLATPGTTGTAIATAGIPTETEFATFHTFLQDGVNTSDEFVMTGAWTTPLDLTDFSVYARLQAGFKLTRTDARFDIVNNAATSKFTITAVSMGNGRRGANCFPITAYGSTPAAAGDLITYPARTAKFKDGDPDKDPEANAGTVEGAFYCSPSPIADGGYLILEGTYQANLTDAPQNVVYRIPFKQANATGGFTNLEINPNHRYTIGITKADDYHVDFDITVADWEDADDINGFEPTAPVITVKATSTAADFEMNAGDARVGQAGGKIAFELFSPEPIMAPTVTFNYEPTYGDPDNENWLTTSVVTTKADPVIDNNFTFTADVAAYPKATDNPSDVHIATITLEWGRSPEERKTFNVYRGASCVTYLDTRYDQTIRFAGVLMKDGRYWAPVNVGAITAKNKASNKTNVDLTDDCGMSFQWGRLDGVKTTNNATIYNTDTILGDLGYPVREDLADMSKWKGKHIIISSIDSKSNWLLINGKGVDNPEYNEMTKDAWYQQLWNANEGKDNTKAVKTNTDPCPEGWRVPTTGEWTAIGVKIISKPSNDGLAYGVTWDGTNNRLTLSGKEKGKNLLLPAAGQRLAHDGRENQVGNVGNYWSSSVYSSNPYMINTIEAVRFYQTLECRMNSDPRGFSKAVRCIQEQK